MAETSVEVRCAVSSARDAPVPDVQGHPEVVGVPRGGDRRCAGPVGGEGCTGDADLKGHAGIEPRRDRDGIGVDGRPLVA